MKKILFHVKQFVKRHYRFINISLVLVDLFAAYSFIKMDNKIYKFIGLAYLIFILYRLGKSIYLFIRSRKDAREYLQDNRVLAVEGKQRVGKTSLCCYFLSVLKSPTYTNVPIELKGKYSKKVSTDILALQHKIPEGSTIYIDECNLYYNNLRNGKSTENNNIFGQSIFCQCVGHFTDGNIIYSSTYTDKLPKEIRVNFSCRSQVLRQYTYQFSFIGSLAFKALCRLFGAKDVYTGLRCWDMQHYEKVHSFEDDEGSNGDYNVDLNNNGKFAPVYTFADFQSYDYYYNDRYMKGLYDVLDKAITERFNSIDIDISDASLLYDAEVFRYMTNIYSRHKQN